MTRKASEEKPQPVGDASAADVEETATATPFGSFPIVGIGASAGGLAAFEAFFSGMPADTDKSGQLTVGPGMAFVLVQHLAPDHKSILADLVQRYTRMEVFEVEDGMAVQPNCAYIIPPNFDMAFLNGALQLLEPAAPRGHRLPIDFFFRSLAQDQRARAIAIVLSGTGSDGALGVRAIKGEGGMVMVQNPKSTEFDGMPRSALATGMVDYELPPAEMPAQLISYVAHAFGKPPRLAVVPAPRIESALKKICILLRAQTGHDFSQYKPRTIQRRIERRMAVYQIETLEQYVKYLQQTPEEVVTLFRDLLIGVTCFFRDPEAFKALEQQVVPQLFAGKSADSVIRVWSLGCSTGEEVYSLAILLAECLELQEQRVRVQVFATDIDSQALATARAGRYPASIAADLSPERLARFFTHEPGDSIYRINKSIRDLLVFSEQDAIRDPPFSRLDLISCRNLLIYMGEELQKKLIPLFHYALNPGGFLFLGTSETVGAFGKLFTALDRKQKLYQRKAGVDGESRALLSRFLPLMNTTETALPRTAVEPELPAKRSLRELTEQTLLQQIVPAAVLVNGKGDIRYIHGHTGLFLEPAPGEAGVDNILKMAREGLQRDLTVALHKAALSKEIVRYSGLQIRTNSDFVTVDLTIRPLAAGSTASSEAVLYLVVLAQVQPDNPALLSVPRPAAATAGSADASAALHAEARIAALQQELQAKDEYLQTTNEELKSSNEEMQSVNEELQSTNEELETSKEELQSVNEELATVNNELRDKLADLTQVNNDMNNLLAGTDIGTVFVDHQLCILRFTPTATKIINLIQSDIGRPLGHLLSNLMDYSELVTDIRAVLNTLIPNEREVQTRAGAWYTMRILPYRTLDNVIEGAVLTFVDITETKKMHESLRLNEARIRVALKASPVIVFNQDTELRYTWIYNPHSQSVAAQVLGKTDADLLPAVDAARLTAVKRRVLDSGVGTRHKIQETIEGKPCFHDLTVEPLYDAAGRIIGITGASIAIAEQQLQDLTDTPVQELPPVPVKDESR